MTLGGVGLRGGGMKVGGGDIHGKDRTGGVGVTHEVI